MKKQVYSVYDLKSEFYGPPVLFHNDEDARRGFASVYSRSDSPMVKYPQDYRVFRLGTFDDNAGVLEMPESGLPVFIAEFASLNPHSESEEKGAS